MKIIPYTSQLGLRIRNVASLPHGTGSRYLECIDGLNGELVAKAWRRKIPATYHVLVDFGGPK